MRQAGELHDRVAAGGFLIELFDRVPGLVVFIKDIEGRYLAINETIVRRLGLAAKSQVLGRTTRELFPAPFGSQYLAQDLAVLQTGRPLTDLLELHLYPNRQEGWCLTTKVPIRDIDGEIIGLAGTSRDVHRPDLGPAPLDDIAVALHVIEERFAEPLRVEELAAAAGMSAYQFGVRIRKLFELTPIQLIIKTRIEAACRMLREGNDPIAEVALACGYCDQSAFSRQFKATVGMSPARYREHSGK